MSDYREAGQRLLDKLADKGAMLDIADRAAKRQEGFLKGSGIGNAVMSDYRVNMDNRSRFAAMRIISRYFQVDGKAHIQTYHPTNLKARLWRWLLGG